MALHDGKQSMLKESLQEMIEVAGYCINFDKTQTWGQPGCYGYPGALLLLSLVDSIGSEVEGGGSDTKQHFKVLNNLDYYNLKLNDNEIETLRNEFRNHLSHNSLIEPGVVLNIGTSASPILKKIQGIHVLSLKPFLDLSEKVLHKFITTLK